MKSIACRTLVAVASVGSALAAACQNGDAGRSASRHATGSSTAQALPDPQAPGAPSSVAPPTTAKAVVTAEYREDITTVCDVIHLSKADEVAPDERWPVIAMWLGPHIKTGEARVFLASIQALKGEPKAQALDDEAQRVGLARCALAASWR